MIAKHITQVVFWTAVVLSVASLALSFAVGDAFLAVAALSLVFNVWSLSRSERGGFVASNQIRRAYEPARRFNTAQVVTVLFLVMAQFGTLVYVLLT